ncbi:MAG: 4-(cytidine 5'-diphospho)-2-C-methyl-D-erythritol kinase [Bacteroidetes bacterium]|nr:4-(cytidine 5'-diphospho)-2-C-methyl-D-erythritol kinase [Bacteroidota bacterium]
MICFPNAKINLGLMVTGKREDGFHNLRTCFYPIPLCDVLEFVPSEKYALTVYGSPLLGDPKKNLVSQVYSAMQQDFDIPPVKVSLLKRIPIQSGLGGGSSDAAFFMKELNGFFGLRLTVADMEKLIAPLGSDCAFFIRNSPAMGEGRGDQLSSVTVSLKGVCATLFVPGFSISTALAYSLVVPSCHESALPVLLAADRNTWRTSLYNDFQSVAERLFPEIALITEEMYKRGAFYASLSGSGSAVYALSDQPLNMSNFPVKGTIYQWIF